MTGPGSTSPWRPRFLGISLLGAFLLILLWIGASLKRPEGGLPTPRRHLPMVAMLRLEAPADPDLAWGASAIPDALRVALARQPMIRVVDRQVAAGQQQRLQTPDLDRLARELRADFLLTGRLSPAPDGHWDVRLRLLKCPGTGIHWETRETLLPGETWSRLEALAQTILQAAGASAPWVPVPDASLPRSQRAWQACSEALDIQVEEDLPSMEASLVKLRQAVSADPGYAPAQAHLAYTLQETAQDANIQGRPGLMQPYFKAAREAALKAVALDPGLGLGHKALGALAMAEGKLDQAENHARRAVELDPSDYHSLVILGDVFAWRADAQSIQAAQNFYRSALAFAPSYWWAHFRLAVADQLSGDLEDAVHHADTGLLLHPDTEFLYVTAADALFWLDRPQAALDRVKAGLTRRPNSPILQLLMAYGAHETGDIETLETYSRKVQAAFAPSHPVHRWAKALQLLGQGDRAGCLALLDGFRKDAEGLATPGTPTMDARIASVNLYFMGRTLAKLGDRPRATTFLELAERLHPGKLGVSRKDPAYRALFNGPG